MLGSYVIDSSREGLGGRRAVVQPPGDPV